MASMDTAFKIKAALVVSAAYWTLLGGIEYLSWTTAGVTHLGKETVAGAVVVWLLGLVGLLAEIFHDGRRAVEDEAWRRARLKDRFEPNAYVMIRAPTAELASATRIPRLLVETSIGSYPKDGDCRLIVMADPTVAIKRVLIPKGVQGNPIIASDKASVRGDGIVGFPCTMRGASTFRRFDGRKTLFLELALAEPEDYRTLCRHAVFEFNKTMSRDAYVVRSCRDIYPLVIPT